MRIGRTARYIGIVLLWFAAACGTQEPAGPGSQASSGNTDNEATETSTDPTASSCEADDTACLEEQNDEGGNTLPPGPEVCGDNIDNDQDGTTDSDCDPDEDLDEDGYTTNEGDCNDGEASANPDGTEIADDGIDQDCDGSDDSNATFSGIQADIFTPKCSICHSGASPPQGLNLSAGLAYSNLVNVDASQADMKRVKPGNPDQSYLIHKLAGTQMDAGGSGLQMPRLSPALGNTEFHQIRNWVTGGAPND